MNRFRQGFTLIEIMVGLVIGMISMIVIMQVFALYEGGKRTTTSGADAQNNGATALYLIEQDARMAGWGMDPSVYANCNTTYTYCDGNANCGGSVGPLADFSLVPVRIVDGGDNPDSITVQYYSNPQISTFGLPGNTTISETMPQPSSELKVASVSGCEVGDLVLVAQAGNCTLMQVTHVQDGPIKHLQHNPGSSAPYNPPAAYQNANGWPAYTAGARLSCFEPPPTNTFFQRVYSIDATSRQLQRGMSGTNELIAPEIIDMQAQYGIAPVGSSVVNEWVNASEMPWTNPTQAQAQRIKAIRVALVARSTQYEKPQPGASCNATTSEMVGDWPSWGGFDATHFDTKYSSDWQCYRYKVFETVIPLRNVT